MKLKNTAFVYNVTVQGSSNCDWGTELGQSSKHTFTLEGFPEFLNAMMYYKIDDVENIKVILGKGNRTLKPFSEYNDCQLVLASCFEKVYVNDKLLEGQRFISYILKEINTHTSNGEINKHNGRCTLKFSNSLTYNGESVNKKCIEAISRAFGQSDNGSWAILEMTIVNEDELHLYGFALGDSPKNYNSKEDRNADFERYLNNDDIEYRRAAFKAYLFAPGTFKSKTTAPLYWKHLSEPQYKNRISFVWEILSSLVGYQTEDLLVIDNIEIANKLKDIVTPDQRNKDYGNQLASAIIKNYIEFLENRKTILKNNGNDNKKLPLDPDFPRQQIFYGAPGTGKSHSIKGDANVKEAEKGNRVFRTTFHPDSDYSTFVGCYKPSMKSGDKIYSAEELSIKLKEIKNTGVPYPCHKFAAKYWRSLKDLDPNSIKHILLACGFTEAYGVEVSKGIAIGQEFLNKDEDGKIIYTFTPQAFTNAYVKAWNTTENVYLIIEEINRGNCAQIFGDLFQLLDRGDDDKSEYPIDSDTDLGNYIAKELENSSRSDFPDGVKDGKKLVLPSNLFIWATMNTSDQSLFPIDSAFKRRWDWVYMPIGYKNTNWTIEIGDKKYEWVKFQRIINDKIYGVDNSEDKQLGDYFVNADRTNEKISADTLLNKVLFYIWNDVCKDEPDQIFQWVNDKKQNESIKFSDFFGVDKDKKLQGFMAYNKVPAIGETDNTDNTENTNIQEETPAENDNEINS